MLTDAEGVVLSRLSGDRSLLKALDDVHLAPGFAYSEREVGTNGLGLALADRVPTLVRADQHYALSLCTFTCAAVPVFDPASGRLEGSVNLTTWSQSSSDLLLALARSAASNTTALMVARSNGRLPRPTSRGQVFRVEVPRLEPGSGTLHELSEAWNDAVARAERAMADGAHRRRGRRGRARAGPPLLAQAARHTYPRDRILSASAPAPTDVQTWLGLWTPELGKAHTAVIVRDVDMLPAWVAERLRDLIQRSAGSGSVPFAVTAERFEDIPTALAGLVDTVVPVPSLRDRPDDVLPLANHIATRARGREIGFSAIGVAGAAVLRLAGQRRRAVAGRLDRGRSGGRRRYRPAAAGGAGGQHPSPVTHRGLRAGRDRPGSQRRRADDGRGRSRTRDEPSDALPQDRPVQHSGSARTRLAADGKSVGLGQLPRLLQREPAAAPGLGYQNPCPHALCSRSPAGLLRAPPAAGALAAQRLGAVIGRRCPSVGITRARERRRPVYRHRVHGVFGLPTPMNRQYVCIVETIQTYCLVYWV